jgi:hypothetical protein
MKIQLEQRHCSAGRSWPARSNISVAGYTFAEVMVAGAVLMFVAASLYGAFAHGFSFIQSTRENLRATQIMVQKLEAVRLFTWSQVCDATNYLATPFTEQYDPLGATNNASGASYSGFITATIPTNLPAAYQTNMRTITVTIFWTNSTGAKRMVHTREMQTQVARSGMQNYIWGNL